MLDSREDETFDIGYDGECDVCGSTDANGFVKVDYVVDGDSTFTQYECFNCHQRATRRERKRQEDAFDEKLV